MTTSILWRRIDLPGHEIATLIFRDDLWELSGTALFSHELRPCRLDYTVYCDYAWRTNAAEIKGLVGDHSVDLDISVDREGRWYINGVQFPEVSGCIDIDLGFSPSTNLLPIRRLSLAVGEEAEVQAAWLPFPSLEFEPLPQRYRREEESLYLYQSRGGSFERRLKVNVAGFVTNYPGLWQIEASIQQGLSIGTNYRGP